MVKLSKKACHDKGWMTESLKNSSKIKNNLYKIWITSSCQDDKIKYLNYKRIFYNLLKKAESDYYRVKFDNRVNDSKYVWKNINELCSFKKNKNNCCINKIEQNGKIIESNLEICNIFNEFFSDVGLKLSEKFVPNSNLTKNSFSESLGSSLSNTYHGEKVTENEIRLAINELKSKRSCGPDELPMIIFKSHRTLLSAPLTFLFNLSLDSGIVPDCLKIAKVIPIYKKGDKKSVNNYRPISLLNNINKILEKVVAKRIGKFFEKYHIIYDFQFGFRQKHSTALALLEVIDNCYNKLDDSNYVLGIYFDLQKAFDSVDHEILLKKLFHYGIRGKMHEWFSSYLKNRQQYTHLNNTISSTRSVKFGVPQGSVLGPLLFIIFVNDLPNVLKHEKIKLFADDTNLFVFAKSLHVLESKANECVNLMESWFSCNKLSVNIDKTCYTLFNYKKDVLTDNLNILLLGTPIVRVKDCKYLGIIIDERLKWDTHIDAIYNNLIKFTSIFAKLRVILPAGV